MDGKRKKGKHFTPQECSLLISLIEEYLAIIENKKTDLVNVTKKNKAWDELTTKFNLSGDNGPRTTVQLRNYYDNYKRKTRKDNADDKAELYKTGGGKFVKKLDEDGERLISLMRTQFQPDKNTFDSATAYHDESVDMEILTGIDDVNDSTDVRVADAPVSVPSSSFSSSSTEARRPKSADYDHRPQPSRERRERRTTPNVVYDKLIRLTDDKSEKMQVRSTYETRKLDLLAMEKKIKEDVAKQNTELNELAKLKLNLEIEGIKIQQKHATELFELQKKKCLIEIRVQENHLELQLDKMQSRDEKI